MQNRILFTERDYSPSELVEAANAINTHFAGLGLDQIRERLEHQVGAVIDAGACALAPTTVVDMSGDEPVLLRQGRGDPALLGL